MRKLVYNAIHCPRTAVSTEKILINNHFDLYTIDRNDVGTIGRVLEGEEK